VLFAAAAVAISLAAPVVRVTPLLAWLPDPLEWYCQAVAWSHELHPVPVGRLRVRGAAVGEIIDGLRSAATGEAASS
jgi:hypothetical protein